MSDVQFSSDFLTQREKGYSFMTSVSMRRLPALGDDIATPRRGLSRDAHANND